MFSFDWNMLQIAFLTVAIELPIFYLCGYKHFQQLLAFAIVNLVSNLLLNESLPTYISTISYWLSLALGEVLVVALEYALMLHLVTAQRIKLFQTIVTTNVISMCAGLWLFF